MRIAFFSATLMASSAVIAATPINGWYSSLFGGYTYIPTNVSVTHLGLVLDSANYNSGYHAGGRIGYKSTPLRYEGEITYIHANLKDFNINNIAQTGVSGENTATLGMANIYYDFGDIVPAIQPFVGLGLGYAWVEGRLNSTGPSFGITRYTASSSGFAYQATAGLTYNFAENYALNMGYRYVGTDRVGALGEVFQAHLATVGVIYRFNEIRYK